MRMEGALSSRPLDVLVMTSGFEPGPLVRAVASHSLGAGSSIIVLAPSFKDDRAERAYLELKRVCDMLFKGSQVSLQRVEVDLTSFGKAVGKVKELLSPLTDRRLSICFCGGMRALCLAVYTACLLLRWQHPPHMEVYLEGMADVLTIPSIHNVIKTNVTEEGLAILRLLQRSGRLSTGNVAALLQKDRSTVYRQLSRLREAGLVSQSGKLYELTELGCMLT